MNTKDSPRLRGHTRLAAIVAGMGLAFSAGFGVAAHAADPALDLADDALQKARALVVSAETGPISPQAQKKFDRHQERAVQLIDRARAEVAAAIETSDGATP